VKLKVEPLHDDLLPWVQERTVLGRLVHSPLVIQTIFTAHYHKLINETYLRKKESLDRALSERRWRSAILLYERPYRFQALQECLNHGLFAESDPEEYWGAVGMVWVDSENIWQNLNDWRETWAPILDEDVNYAMGEEQRQRLAAMPDLIPIWRGFSHTDGEDGLSWSFTKDRATWFARRFAEFEGRAPRLASGMAPKNKVLALFDREDEIVIFPEDVQDRTVQKLTEKKE
jgi:hypothetical protein